MKVQHGKDLASHSGPESCGGACEGAAEALAGETGGSAIEPRNPEYGTPTQLSDAEGNMNRDDTRESWGSSARSQTPYTPGSFLHRSWEISAVPGGTTPGGPEKAKSRTPGQSMAEKSDALVVPEKPSNKGEQPTEMAEGRSAAKGNAGQDPTPRTQGRTSCVSTGLEGVRQAARRDRRLQFTALLHHITPQLLMDSFYSLQKNAAAGVDGVTWREYEKILPQRVTEVHRKIYSGAYRATPSRRVYIPKADGRQRPLGIASIEDKIVQQAVVTVLSAIYEEDFLGFSYGFRPGRGQHDALDALTAGIKSRKVNWIVDADIRSFFDEIDHGWMLRFLEHRIADQRIIRLIRKWLEAGVIEDGKRIPAVKGTPQGAVISPLLANIYLHYAFDLWVQHWRKQPGRGEVIVARYADDSVVGFEEVRTARAFLEDLRERLAKFGLTLHPDKTRLIEFGRFAAERRRQRGQGGPETFDFLGFTHCCGTDRQGKFQVVRLTAKKRMRATLTAIRDKLYQRRHQPVPIVGAWLQRVLNGYFAYHAVPTNLWRLDGLRTEVCRAWRHALLRRSQRHRLPWSRFNRLTRKYVPACRVLHPYPEVRFFASHPTLGRSRMR
jgi:group II intron reverse transcriptase/maturase